MSGYPTKMHQKLFLLLFKTPAATFSKKKKKTQHFGRVAPAIFKYQIMKTTKLPKRRRPCWKTGASKSELQRWLYSSLVRSEKVKYVTVAEHKEEKIPSLSLSINAAKTAENSWKIQPDYLNTLVLISLEVAQFKSMIFFAKSGP